MNKNRFDNATSKVRRLQPNNKSYLDKIINLLVEDISLELKNNELWGELSEANQNDLSNEVKHRVTKIINIVIKQKK